MAVVDEGDSVQIDNSKIRSCWFHFVNIDHFVHLFFFFAHLFVSTYSIYVVSIRIKSIMLVWDESVLALLIFLFSIIVVILAISLINVVKYADNQNIKMNIESN